MVQFYNQELKRVEPPPSNDVVIPRITVYAFVGCWIEGTYSVLFVKSRFKHGRFELVGGGKDPCESYQDALCREIYEEVKIQDIRLLDEGPFHVSQSFFFSFREKYYDSTNLFFRAEVSNEQVIPQQKEISEALWLPKSRIVPTMCHPIIQRAVECYCSS